MQDALLIVASAQSIVLKSLPSNAPDVEQVY